MLCKVSILHGEEVPRVDSSPAGRPTVSVKLRAELRGSAAESAAVCELISLLITGPHRLSARWRAAIRGTRTRSRTSWRKTAMERGRPADRPARPLPQLALPCHRWTCLGHHDPKCCCQRHSPHPHCSSSGNNVFGFTGPRSVLQLTSPDTPASLGASASPQLHTGHASSLPHLMSGSPIFTGKHTSARAAMCVLSFLSSITSPASDSRALIGEEIGAPYRPSTEQGHSAR